MSMTSVFAGKCGTNECFEIMTCFSQCADRLGIPIASKKTVWPCTNLVYLGLELDSIDMVVHMPKSKITEIVPQIQVISLKKVTLKVMQMCGIIVKFVYHLRLFSFGIDLCIYINSDFIVENSYHKAPGDLSELGLKYLVKIVQPVK